MNNELIKFLNENFYNVEVVNRKSYNVFNFGKRIKNKYNDNKYEYFINNFGNSYIFCAQKDCVDINIDNEIYINRGFNNVNDLIKFIKNDIIK